MYIGSARPAAARLVVAVSLVAALAYAEPSVAERALRESEAELVHFAFATQLGSGVYSIGGRTVQIYRLPFAWSIADGIALGFIAYPLLKVISGRPKEASPQVSLQAGVKVM